jgi:RND family efflux transporter MFP subunit
VLLGLAVLGGVGAGLYYFGGSLLLNKEREDLIYHTVREEPLEVTVVERGTLEAARNDDIVCMVKASGRGSTAATTIKWVIEDGSHVKKGDKVIELDRSGLEDQKLAQMINVEKARAAVIKAEGDLQTVISQNDSDELDAQAKLDVAKLDLEKYIFNKDGKGGEYQRDLNKILGDLKEAESNVEMWRERAAWTRRMFEKKFKTINEVEADEAKLKSAELVVRKLKDELTVMQEFMYRRNVVDLESKVKLAEEALKRVRIQRKAKEATARSELETAKKTLEQEEAKLKDIEEQLSYCTMYAPKDGMVVYFVDERSRGGFGAQSSVIAQGEPVREGQKLIRIPDLSSMLVNTRVHEAMVSRVRPGMKVGVRVDALRDRVLKGSVKSVATIAIQLDWRSAGDVKMYQTIVSIDETVPGLKPGMSAEVTIHVDATDKPVPTVPVQAIVGGPEMGTKRTVFVKGPDGKPVEREVEIGLTNDKVAEIRSGLKAGEEVVLNPKALVGDRMKTRQPAELPGAPSAAPSNGSAPSGPANGAPKPPTGGAPGSLGSGPGTGPSAGGPPGAGGPGGPATAGGGRRGFNPALLNDPEIKKRMMEDPRIQAIMKEQGVDDVSKIDWSKVRIPGRGAGGGGPGGGGPGGPPAGGAPPMP